MLIIKDRFQEYIENNFSSQMLVLMNEILFYGIFVYYYYFGPIQNSEQNFTIVKYIGIIFIIKYLFNYVTSISEVINSHKTKEDKKDNGDKEKTYFQFNSKIAIFSILILFLSMNQNVIVTLSILFGYALLSSGAKYGYTVDNILTVFVVYFLYSLNAV